MPRTAEAQPKERGAGKDLMRVMARQRGQAPVSKPQSPFDIIKATMEKQAPPAEAAKYVAAIAAMAKKGACKPLQIGNTVFLLFPKGPGVFEFHTATTEPADVLVDRFKAGVKAAKQLGAKQLYSYFTDPSFLRIAEMSGLQAKVTQSQQMVKGGMRPAYKVEVTV